MASIRQTVSDIRSINKLLSSDALITDRFIYQEAWTTNLQFIKQQTNKRLLFQSSNIFTSVPCLQMTTVPIGECCDYTSECNVSKSVEQIPRIAEGVFGSLVQRVSSIDNLFNFRESTARRYANILQLGLPKYNGYFWIYNNHLYTSNPDVQTVNLIAFFEEKVPNTLLYPSDCDCKPKPSLEDRCKNPLDEEFRCPGYLFDAVKTTVSQKLLRSYFNLAEDKTSDNRDDTSK